MDRVPLPLVMRRVPQFFSIGLSVGVRLVVRV